MSVRLMSFLLALAVATALPATAADAVKGLEIARAADSHRTAEMGQQPPNDRFDLAAPHGTVSPRMVNYAPAVRRAAGGDRRSDDGRRLAG